jgi:hypothetical protein
VTQLPLPGDPAPTCPTPCDLPESNTYGRSTIIMSYCNF